MASVFRHYHHPVIWVASGALILGMSAGAAWRAVTALPDPESLTAPSDHPAPEPGITAKRLSLPDYPSVFQAPPGTRPPDEPPIRRLAERFRLAGTFFMLSADLHPSTRKAVLVDAQSGADHIVQEGDVLDEITVLAVAHDHVILEIGEIRETLGLERSAREIDGIASLDTASPDPDDATAGAENRFGEQIADNRWVFRRDHLLDYYQEVMRSPRRLKQVFDSMEPLYDDNRKITGYTLNIKGEADFFEAVGLREGDVVRHVNSMAMSSRLRAEFLIREFVHDRLNVFVLDVDREGTTEQLIYEIR